MPRWVFAPAALSVLLLAGALFARSPLERLDAPAGVGTGIHLAFSPAYLALDPLCRLLDALSLLSLPQHLALCATLISGGLVWSLYRRRARPYVAVAIMAVAIACAYAAGVLMPRPMAALAVDAPDMLTIDFHSHTSASHDGRPGFDLEHNRAWHAAAGFDVAYVSDHASWNAIKGDDHEMSARAGRTVMLSAVEAGFGRARVIALGAPSVYAAALHGNQLDGRALAMRTAAGRGPATLIYTVPAPEQALRSRQLPRIPGLEGIEISDACPRGLGQSRAYHEELEAWADQINVALVTASDNHGWGWTAAAWTLMKLPRWQGMRAPALAAAIESKLHRDGRRATTVVAWRPPAGNLSGWQLIATMPALAWNLSTSLSPAERFSWASYAWGLALLRRLWRNRRREERADALPAATL